MAKNKGLLGRMARAFWLQVGFITIAAILGVYLATIVIEETLVKKAILEEAEYFWKHYYGDGDFKLPDTKNLTGYFNPELLRVLAEQGADFECVSPGEVEWLQETLPDLDLSRILFTPNFAPRDEYEWALDEGLQITLDNLHPLREWPELFRDR